MRERANLFITDINHNYVYLRKMGPQRNYDFPKCFINNTRPEDDVKFMLGMEARFEKVDTTYLGGYTFHRFVVESYTKSHCGHEWVPISGLKSLRIPPFKQRLITDLKFPLMYHSAGSIITDENNNILLVKGRISQKYGFPKGHLKPCECAIDGAIRETKEETGLSFDFDAMNSVNYRKTKLFKLNGCVAREPQPIDEREVSDARWVSMDSIDGYDLTKQAKTILK